MSASSQEANTKERGWGGQAVFAYCEGGRVRELLLGNMFLDDRSSALLSDQSNYFWQICAVHCGLSLACKERNGCINIQNVFDPLIKLEVLQELVIWHTYPFLSLSVFSTVFLNWLPWCESGLF